MRAHVARHPEDASGWYLLADAQLHVFPLLNITTSDELYEPFDRALELDPSFTPAALHPLELSVMLDDSARFNRYIAGLDSIALGPLAAFWRSVGNVRWRRIVMGDTVAGIEEFAVNLQRAGFGSSTQNLVLKLRVQLALIEITRPERRDAAIRLLRLLTAFEPSYSVLFAVPMAEAYERAGMTAEAARTWMRYIAVLEQGDPEAQPFVEAARLRPRNPRRPRKPIAEPAAEMHVTYTAGDRTCSRNRTRRRSRSRSHPLP